MILLDCFSFEIAHFIFLVSLSLPSQFVDPLCSLHGSSSEKAEKRNVVQCHTSGKRSYSEAAALRGRAPSHGTFRPFLLLTSFRAVYVSSNAFFKCIRQMSSPKHNRQ